MLPRVILIIIKICQKQRVFLTLVDGICTAYLKACFFGESLRDVYKRQRLEYGTARIAYSSAYTNQAISQAQNLHEETQTLLDDFNRKKR